MTDEQEALAMVNEAFVECGYDCDDNFNASLPSHRTALRAVRERKAFAQEVSDAIESALPYMGVGCAISKEQEDRLSRFIIAKPDPLVEVIKDMDAKPVPYTNAKAYSDRLRAALAKHNGRIVFDD